MTVNEMAAIETMNRLRELTPEENDRIYECLEGRNDPRMSREQILGFQKEVEEILESHGLEPWDYMRFTIKTKRGIIINTYEIMRCYDCYIDDSGWCYSELNRLNECLEARAKLLLCEGSDLDPMLRHEKLDQLLNEAKSILEPHGLVPQQYVKFNKRMRPSVVTNVFGIDVVNFYRETYGKGVI